MILGAQGPATKEQAAEAVVVQGPARDPLLQVLR
jgi:hypothetical protein